MKRLGNLILITVITITIAVPIQAGPPVNGQPDHNSVYNYAINWAVQTGTTEVTVQVQARYCSGCNPNPSNNPGCPEFNHGYPPPYYPFHYWNYYLCYYNNGRYTAVRVKDSGGTILATQKMICNPSNWPINVVHTENFIFPGLPLSAGDTITVEADTFCSWCGHWYPSPVTLLVIGSDSQVTYTGDTSALAGTTANVCAILVDADTGDPLVGKTVKFTLNPTSPIAMVSAVTDTSGVACTTMFVPPGTSAGTYTMDTRFAGDASYFPSSDQDDFEVFVKIPVPVDIKPTSCPNPLNVGSNGVLPVAIVGTEDFDVTTVDPGTVKLIGVEPLRFSYEDVCTPYIQYLGKETQFYCTDEGPDGFLDLTLKFDKQAIVEALGDVADGEVKVLSLKGKLLPEHSGTPIVGEDVVVILNKGKY